MTRISQQTRATKETEIRVYLDLDGDGKGKISTGIGFFDHMLEALALHAGWTLEVEVRGDLHVDGHHTVEDTGIVLGRAFAEALGEDSCIQRYGTAFIPMDEALARCVLDVSGRAYLVFEADLKAAGVGDFDSQLVKEFFKAFAMQAGITLHLSLLYGDNTHHMIEALFKAVAHALREASRERTQLLSTKGVID